MARMVAKAQSESPYFIGKPHFSGKIGFLRGIPYKEEVGGSSPSSPMFKRRFGMREVRRLFLAVAIACGSSACTHNNFTPNVIQLTPHGTAASPVNKSIASSFTLIAVEDGYTGLFTAQTIVGACWVVQTPTSTSGAFTIAPEGLTCAEHDTEQIQVKDAKGNSATTYIHSV
jgi:hypothetical protein